MERNPREYRRFLVVTDTLAEQIAKGLIRSGCPFLNRAEICAQFGISPVTAHKVQKELERRGLISSRNGRSFMVCDPGDLGKVPLRLIRLLRQVPTGSVDLVMNAISGGARSCCEKYGIEFQEEFVELLDHNSRKLNVTGDCSEGEGIILHPYKEMMLRSASYFLKYWFKRVTIDNTLPDTPGVLVDSLDGLMQLFAVARRRGVKRMMLIPSVSSWQVTYVPERMHLAPALSAQFGIALEMELATNFDAWARDIERSSPDAILLLYDDSFEQLEAALTERLGKMPPVYLFARNMIPRPQCIAYETDYRELGEAAVKELLMPRTVNSGFFLNYIKGTLKVPEE